MRSIWKPGCCPKLCLRARETHIPEISRGQIGALGLLGLRRCYRRPHDAVAPCATNGSSRAPLLGHSRAFGREEWCLLAASQSRVSGQWTQLGGYPYVPISACSALLTLPVSVGSRETAPRAAGRVEAQGEVRD